MRKTVRLLSAVGPTERLGRAIATLPPGVRRTLAAVAARDDLPLVAGSWHGDDSGCLVANAVACAAGEVDEAQRTLDLRMLDAFPELSSRDLNLLIVAWDEAAAQDGATDDADLRRLLRAALRWAGVAADAEGMTATAADDAGLRRGHGAAPPPEGIGDGAAGVPVGAGERR
jgi:hypothetical protein